MTRTIQTQPNTGALVWFYHIYKGVSEHKNRQPYNIDNE